MSGGMLAVHSSAWVYDGSVTFGASEERAAAASLRAAEVAAFSARSDALRSSAIFCLNALA